MPNMFEMAKEALAMRSQMKKIQKQLEAMTADYSNAGVTVTARGDMSIVSVEMTDEAFVDRVRLQRTITENVNKALKLVKDKATNEMRELTKDTNVGRFLGGN